MKTVGQHIAEARRGQHKTLRSLAKDADVSPALLSMIEHGKQRPSKELIVRLAVLLDGDADMWCGLAGLVTPDAENRLAALAKDDPMFFRNMVARLGRS